VHVFGKNKSILTIADALRNIGFETIALVASEGIEFLVRHYVTKFDDVITPKNMKSNFNTTKANRKMLDTLCSILHHITRVSKENELTFEVVGRALYRALYAFGIELVTPYVTAEQAISAATTVLRNNRKPKFLWIHLVDLHAPYTRQSIRETGILDYIFTMFKLALNDYKNSKRTIKRIEALLSELENSKDLRNTLIRIYENSLASLLKILRAFIDEVMSSNQDKWYIIITADHGEEFFEHKAFEHLGIISHYGFIPHLYNELLHVPLLIVGPNIKGNHLLEYQCTHYDIMPTILDLILNSAKTYYLRNTIEKIVLYTSKSSNTNATSVIYVENDDIAPAFKARKYIVAESEALIKSITGMEGYGLSVAVILHDRWKYIFNPLIGIEVFDLKNDPYERRNVVDIIDNTLKRKMINIHLQHVKRIPRLRIMNKVRYMSMKLHVQ